MRWLPLGAALLLGGCSANAAFGGDDDARVSDASYGPDASHDGSVFGDAATDAGLNAADASFFGPPGLQLRDIDPTVTTTLAPGQTLELEVRVLDSYGQPLVDQRVDFALLGAPAGSTLHDLFAFSDAEGKLRVYVQAGLVQTTFQVRISLGTSQIYLPIDVSPANLVDLGLTLYPSVVGLVSDVYATAYAGLDCGSIAGVPPSAAVAFGAATSVKLGPLAEGTLYAVVAQANVTGGVAVEQCFDAVAPGVTVLPALDFGLVDPPVGP